MTNSMYPDGYRPESSSDGAYLKIKEGDTKIRILSAPLIGYVGWTNEKKPIRAKTIDELDKTNLKDMPREFHAFVIWNYNNNRLEVAEFTQMSIKNDIFNLATSEDWGDCRHYDIVIKRKGTSFSDTEYSVIPSPKTELTPDILEEAKNSKIKLEKLFTGDNPFGDTLEPQSPPQASQSLSEQPSNRFEDKNWSPKETTTQNIPF